MKKNTDKSHSAGLEDLGLVGSLYGLTDHQLVQLEEFYTLLQAWNDFHNLTAITDRQAIVLDHFVDSLSITAFLDVAASKGLADVGAGGGFPGIPLAIMFPDKPIFLIEVNQKKVAFLEEVAEKLQLTNVTICDVDWRTFLRKTGYDIDLFCARASLQPEELCRLFKPSCLYRTARLVYWASATWQPATQEEERCLQKAYSYTVGQKKRQLILFTDTKKEEA